MSRTDKVFKPALKGKKIPILTLDNKWHKLFPKGKTKLIENTATQLNELLMRQGKVNTQIKEVKALKKKLMDGIVSTADELHTGKGQSINEKKLSESKRLIEECNEKLDSYEDEQLDLPRLIEDKNYELMLMTMDNCYEALTNNTEEIKRIEKWVNEIRVELKKKLILKQELEDANHTMYSYMHDIFGADVIELFDLKYNPEEKFYKKEKKKADDCR